MAVGSKPQVGEEDVLALSRNREEPAWLQELRLAGWKAFQERPLPRLERTRLNDRMFEDFALATPQPRVSRWDELGEAVAHGLGQSAAPDNGVVLSNGFAVWQRLPQEWADKGVIFSSLAEAVVRHPELVQRYLAREAVPATADKPWALNAALWTDGVFLYVPEGVDVEVPLQMFLWADDPALGLFDRTLIVAERNSNVTLVETVASTADSGPRLRVSAVEVYAGANSQVKVCGLQTLSDVTTNLVFRRAVIGEDAQVHWVLGEFGSSLSTVLCDSQLDERGGISTNLTVFFSDGDQHLDVEPRMFHTGTYTQSDILVKGVAKDRSRAVYAPLTLLDDGADESSAFQRGTTLLLDAEARAYCIPQLHVVEEKVAGAGHAATVGQLDDEQLFYLRSRGLTEQDAKKLMVSGFFDPMIARIPVPEVQERLTELIDRKMDG